jgi:hypothetical protein
MLKAFKTQRLMAIDFAITPNEPIPANSLDFSERLDA